MRAPRALLALALCHILILQAITFVPASAASFVGEWTGRIDGDFTGYDDGAFGIFKRSAELTFEVATDGSITGTGTGWEEYRGHGSSTSHGRADNVNFKIRGAIVDYDTGEALLSLEEVTPNEYQTYYGQTQVQEGFKMHPFQAWRTFHIELREGARVDSGAVRTLPGYPPASGTDAFVITGGGGGGSNVECPALTITPTMPPPPYGWNFAGPTDTVSYRFKVEWEGTTPVKVYFDGQVEQIGGGQGGSNSVNPNFVFNPANMQTSPISILMDVTTYDAEEDDYFITVDAWVIDPDTGQECHDDQTYSDVYLGVGDSSAADVPLVKRVGEVQIITEETDAGGKKVSVETGNDGAVTVVGAGIETADNSVSLTTIDVGSNTKIKEYDRVSYSKVLEDRTGEAPAWIKNYYQKFKEPSTLESIKEGALEVLAANANVYSCLFAYVDTSIQELCGEESIVYVSSGDLHLYHKSATGEAADKLIDEAEKQVIGESFEEIRNVAWNKLFKAFATSNALIMPKGTEIAVNVQESVDSIITSVTVLDGSALVVDLVSEEMTLVNAGEKYTLETSFDGQTVSSTDKLEDVGKDSGQDADIVINGFGTARDMEFTSEWAYDAKAANMTSVFSNNDEDVWAWIEFINAYPWEGHRFNYKWYAPDGSLYRSDEGWQPLGIENLHTIHDHDRMEIRGFEAADKPGRWRVEVYYEGDFAQEISFYITKNTLTKNQSVTYEVIANVVSDNEEFNTSFENNLALGFVGAFAGAEDISGIDDIEWVKTTVLDNSAEGRLQDTLKLKGKNSIDGEPRSLSDAFPSSFIPTIGIDEDFTIQTGISDPFPSELAFDRIVDLNVGGSSIKAFEFSGNKKLVEGDSSSGMTMISHYEKDTGILVDSLISGSGVAPEIGDIELDFGLKATELSIPTTLTISSIPSEIQQNQDVSVSGTISPPVNEGQVVLTYKKNDASDEPIKRTVTVTNGVFSDTYKMEKDGTYAVSAEYLGSEAYLSSTTDAATLTVTPSGCLIATAAFGSELTPQVQFLRNFRDNHILSTSAGSSFMNVFNSWYYSFSPAVADYEREQPWLQTTVKAAIYPLLGILQVSENAYSLIPGEYGALSAGMIASGMIGALYLSPVALSIKQVRKSRFNYRLAIFIIAAAFIAVVSAILASNETALMITTSLFVLSIISITAILSGKALMKIYQNLKDALRKP